MDSDNHMKHFHYSWTTKSPKNNSLETVNNLTNNNLTNEEITFICSSCSKRCFKINEFKIKNSKIKLLAFNEFKKYKFDKCSLTENIINVCDPCVDILNGSYEKILSFLCDSCSSYVYGIKISIRNKKNKSKTTVGYDVLDCKTKIGYRLCKKCYKDKSLLYRIFDIKRMHRIYEGSVIM